MKYVDTCYKKLLVKDAIIVLTLYEAVIVSGVYRGYLDPVYTRYLGVFIPVSLGACTRYLGVFIPVSLGG